MNQAMTVERVDNAGYVRTISVPRRMEQPIADHSLEVIKSAQNRLRSSQYFELRKLSCDFKHGELIMRGQVSSFYMKQRAQESIRAIVGSMRIVNLLDVIYAQRTPNEDVAVGGA